MSNLKTYDPQIEPRQLADSDWERMLSLCRGAKQDAYSQMDNERWRDIEDCVRACWKVDRMRRVGVLP